MDKFIISVKDKRTGRDVVTPYIVNSLNGFGRYCERVASCGCIVVVDYISEKDNYVELKTVCKNEEE